MLYKCFNFFKVDKKWKGAWPRGYVGVAIELNIYSNNPEHCQLWIVSRKDSNCYVKEYESFQLLLEDFSVLPDILTEDYLISKLFNQTTYDPVPF
jgi:hypothetical protein